MSRPFRLSLSVRFCTKQAKLDVRSVAYIQIHARMLEPKPLSKLSIASSIILGAGVLAMALTIAIVFIDNT